MAYDGPMPLTIQKGGSGASSFSAYAPIIGGTTSTSSLQSASTGISTAGFVLTSTGASSAPTFQSPVYNISTVTNVNSAASPYTVLASDFYISVNSTAGPVTLLFPNSPALGRHWSIKDGSGTSGTNAITITTVAGTDLIDGATSYVINTSYQSADLIANTTSTYQIY